MSDLYTLDVIFLIVFDTIINSIQLYHKFLCILFFIVFCVTYYIIT